MLRRIINRRFCENVRFYKLSKLEQFTKAESLEKEADKAPTDASILQRYIQALYKSNQYKKAYSEYLTRKVHLPPSEDDKLTSYIMRLYGPYSASYVQTQGDKVGVMGRLYFLFMMGVPIYYILKFIYAAFTEKKESEKKEEKKEKETKTSSGKSINLVGMSLLNSGAIKPEANLKERFKDVVGIDEFKSELEEIVDYLNDPNKYTSVGASFPRGILLSGPPGTGKTLIARAIAGEAKCSFFYKSASEFDQMYRGTGKDNVKNLFAAAKESAPSIIFVDEIDSLAGSRDGDRGGRATTINQLLTELDGFQKSDNVIFIAATNVEDRLDPAVMRSGRIDKVIRIPLPDIGGREKIIDYYLSRIQHFGVDPKALAKRTIGFSGADIKNFVNTAILHAVRSDKQKAESSDFDYAYDRIQMGVRRKNPLLNKQRKYETAVRHIGQAVTAYYTEGSKKFYKVTILPSGNTLGHISMLPAKNELSASRKNIIADIDVSIAGRAAEEVFFGEDKTTTACSRELEKAANLAYFYARDMGMSNDKLFINAEPDKMSDKYKFKSDVVVQEIMEESLERTKKLIGGKRGQVEKLVKYLLEKETLSFEEFEQILKKGYL